MKSHIVGIDLCSEFYCEKNAFDMTGDHVLKHAQNSSAVGFWNAQDLHREFVEANLNE